MKIFLVDDHAMLLDGMRKIINDQANMQVVGAATDAEDALLRLETSGADILITDYNLPNMSGLDLIKKVKKLYPEMKIIVLSMHDEGSIVRSVLLEGISGYVLKSDTHRELLHAIAASAESRTFLSSNVNRKIMEVLHEPQQKPLLTEREMDVLKLIAAEYSNKEIGEKLFISERTVETHRKNIFRKTKTTGIVGLLKYAYAQKWVE